MLNIIEIIKEATSLTEGDRGQILLPKSMPVKGDNKAQKMGVNPDPSKVIGKKKKKVVESRFDNAKSALSGRGKTHSPTTKGRVRVYKSITYALKRGYMGEIFSTKDSDRLYVITKRKWGTDPEQIINGRSAKGFSPGSIPASFKDVKKYSVRTMFRHAGSSDLKASEDVKGVKR